MQPIEETYKSNKTIENQLVQSSEDHEGMILFIIYSNCYQQENKQSGNSIFQTPNFLI